MHDSGCVGERFVWQRAAPGARAASCLVVMLACAGVLLSAACLGEREAEQAQVGADADLAARQVVVGTHMVADSAAAPHPATAVRSDFASGSIGQVERVGNTAWVLTLRDDHEDPARPHSSRGWWYLRLDSVPVDEPLTILLTGLGNEPSYTPVYSYDRRTWHRFDESEVLQPSEDTLLLSRSFAGPEAGKGDRRTVWLARSHPYTAADLQAYLDTLQGNAHVAREVIGQTAQGRSIEMLTITDFAVDEAGKSRIWVYARSHPGETGGSFLVEGLIDFLLGGGDEAQAARSHFVFHIVPMHNEDGVVAGNHRTTPGGRDLVATWHYDEKKPWSLTEAAPREVRALRDAIVGFQEQPDPIPVTMAIGLHSIAGPHGTCAFADPHFGPEALGYTAEQARLWERQMRFVKAVLRSLDQAPSEPLPEDGGEVFVAQYLPETWWWLNFGAEVMAITMDASCMQPGGTPADLRSLGRSMGRAILSYRGLIPELASALPAVTGPRRGPALAVGVR